MSPRTRRSLALLAVLLALPQLPRAYAGPKPGPMTLDSLGAPHIYTPYQFGGVGDGERLLCTVTTTAGAADLQVSGCAPFTSADVGKRIVVNNAGASPTTPLATTISAYISATEVTMAANAGQTLAGVSEAVTISTDDGAALQSCIIQAATSNVTEGASVCYIPPAPGGFWGTAETLELYPSNRNAVVWGAGRERSQVIALVPLSSLVHRSSGYAAGGELRDIAFDGNKLATDTGYFSCAVQRHDSNVGYYNAASDADLVLGDSTGHSESCNGSFEHDIVAENYGTTVDAAMPLYSGSDLPSDNIVVGGTDTTWSGIKCINALADGIVLSDTVGAANNTSLRSIHCFSPDATNVTTAVLVSAAKQRLYDVVCDNGILVCVDVENVDVGIFGGIYEGNLTSSATGIKVASSESQIVVEGFDGSTITTQANRVQVNAPVATNVCAVANPGAIDYCNAAPGLRVITTGSSVNYLSLSDGATGVAPQILALGSDTNINLAISAKGSGTIKLNSAVQATSMPTSCTGAATGTLWNNSGVVNICP